MNSSIRIIINTETALTIRFKYKIQISLNYSLLFRSILSFYKANRLVRGKWVEGQLAKVFRLLYFGAGLHSIELITSSSSSSITRVFISYIIIFNQRTKLFITGNFKNSCYGFNFLQSRWFDLIFSFIQVQIFRPL